MTIILVNGAAIHIYDHLCTGAQDNDDLERLMLAHSRRFQSLLAKSRRSIKAGKGVSHDEFWKAVAHQAKRSSHVRKKPKLGP